MGNWVFPVMRRRFSTMPVTQLNTEQINRYKRHLILPEVGM
jgi:hypothetical protein